MDVDNSWNALLDPGRTTDYFAEVATTLDSRPQHWDLRWAHLLAEFSRWIYRDQQRPELLARSGWREQQFLSHRGTQCAILSNPANATSPCNVLVFRGTSELRDWVTNLRAVPTGWSPGGRVHRGFARAYAKVAAALQPCLDQLEGPCFYTGHSLGAALATLAASERPPLATYAFGSPRVGDAEFTASLSTPLYRVVNHRDIVTTLPPHIESLGLVHAGHLRRLTSDGRLVENPESPTSDHESIHDLTNRRRWFDPPETLSDHAPINYVARLGHLLPRP